MPAADRVLQLLVDVLQRRPVDPALLRDFVRERVPEGPFLEYKRGQWLDTHEAQDLRGYVSGFANAEGGVLILGIVGGEDVQGPDKWSLEPPKCPDQAGWEVWLGKVLADVSAKTRVDWQVVSVEGNDLVVIAANRAEALIRVYEKPNLVCYLRVGEHTHPIQETLFADLAVGRRAKPDLALEELSVNTGTDASGFFVAVNLVVHNQGLLWVSDLSVTWSGYRTTGWSGHGPKGAPVSASLERSLDLRPTSRRGIEPVIAPFRSWIPGGEGGSWLSISNKQAKDARPFELVRFATPILGVPIVPEPWAWYGAAMVLPQNSAPLWAQLAVHGNNNVQLDAKAWALPPGASPVVAWFQGNNVPPSIAAFFGIGAPS
jgi:hypothetical protein